MVKKKLPAETAEEKQQVQIVKRKPNWTRIGIVIGILVLAVVVWFVLKPAPTPSNGVTGSAVKLSYSIELANGTVISSDTAEFVVGSIGSSLGLASDRVDTIIGNMSEDEERTIELTAEEAFGEYDQNKVTIVNRTEQIERVNEINRTFEWEVDWFTQVVGEEPVEGQEYEPQGAPWSLKVIAIEGSSVTVSQEVEAGEIVPVSEILFWEITDVTDDKIKMRLNAYKQTMDTPNGELEISINESHILFTLTPVIGQEVSLGNTAGKVKSFNETAIVIDNNPDYAGQAVTIKLKVEEIKTVSVTGSTVITDIPGAPTLDVFIMTHCPYGTQIEKGLLLVYELLGDKANIKIRFVSYIMHGDKEEQETKRQLCLREETGLFWPYLECFLEDGDSYRCLAEVGADESAINTCMVSKADSYWQVDKELNEQYGVRGSPTVVLDGEVTEVWPRSPENIKNILCDAFDDKPAECSQQLSTENPSTGFGFAASTSSGGGSCG